MFRTGNSSGTSTSQRRKLGHPTEEPCGRWWWLRSSLPNEMGENFNILIIISYTFIYHLKQYLPNISEMWNLKRCGNVRCKEAAYQQVLKSKYAKCLDLGAIREIYYKVDGIQWYIANKDEWYPAITWYSLAKRTMSYSLIFRFCSFGTSQIPVDCFTNMDDVSASKYL